MQYFLDPFISPRPFFYPTVIWKFIHTISTLEEARNCIYFALEGVERGMCASNITVTLHKPYQSLIKEGFKEYSWVLPSTLVLAILWKPSARGYIIKKELIPDMDLADVVIKANLFPFAHNIKMRYKHLRVFYYMYQGVWYYPSDLVLRHCASSKTKYIGG